MAENIDWAARQPGKGIAGIARSTGAEARLSNWDGHFTVDNNAVSTFCCPSFLQRTPLNVQQHNIYSATATTPQINNRQQQQEELITNEPQYNKDQILYESFYNDLTSLSSSRESATGNGDNKWNQSPVGGYSQRSDSGTIVTDQLSASTSQQPSSQPQMTSSREQRMGMGSSFLGDSMTEIVAEDIPNENEPTSALLDYCKRKFLKPYVSLLSLVGLSPIPTESTFFRSCLYYILDVLILTLLVFGYTLQYLTSYRGDRGFSNYQQILTINKIVPSLRENTIRTIGELLFGYIIPNLLHLLSFITSVFVCRVVHNEQLQNLIERVFLMSMKPRRLCMILWLFVALGFGLLLLRLTYATASVFLSTQFPKLKWMNETIYINWQTALKVLLLGAIFIQDLMEIIIISSYCIECYLLRVHLETLSHKLLMHSIDFLDWMREVLEFRKLLDHLNQRVALPVCFLIIMNLSYASAGIIYLFKDFDFNYSELKVVILNIINVLLWLCMGLVPFFMAATVTRVCLAAKATGHQIRVRPFVYHNTSSEDLNSTLMFATSLDMSAKLFRMPIQQNYLCFAILIVTIVILTLERPVVAMVLHPYNELNCHKALVCLILVFILVIIAVTIIASH